MQNSTVPTDSGVLVYPTDEARRAWANYGTFENASGATIQRAVPLYVEAVPRISTDDDRYWGEGFATDTGDVQSPYGHMFLVDNHLCHTDEQGFHTTFVYATNADAEVAFAHAERVYLAWWSAAVTIEGDVSL